MPTTTATSRRVEHSIRFESAPCSRCDGTGHHSYNPIEGTVCFQCRGAKYQLTPNGMRARAAYRALVDERLSVNAEEVTPGTLVYAQARSAKTAWGTEYKKARRTVDAVTVTDDGHVHVTFTKEDFYWIFEATTTRVRVSSPELREVHVQLMREIARRFRGATLVKTEPKIPAPAPESAPAPATPDMSGTHNAASPADMTPYTLYKGTYGPEGTEWTTVRTVTGLDALRAGLADEHVPADVYAGRWFRRGTTVTGSVWHWSATTPEHPIEALSAVYLAADEAAEKRDNAHRSMTAHLERVRHLSATRDRGALAAEMDRANVAREAYNAACREASSARTAYDEAVAAWTGNAGDVSLLPWNWLAPAPAV